MAAKGSRPRSLLQDENAGNALLSGKAPGAAAGNKATGLKPQQQQQPFNERKKLSNITNKLQPLSTNSSTGKSGTENGGGKAALQGFSIKADPEFAAASKSGFQNSSAKIAPTPRVPLKNITNGNQRQEQSHAENTKLPKQKANVETQGQTDAKFKFPPSSKLNLTEEMKKKAALWAQEGIERVHFSGKDMEALREKMEEEEMEKRIAMVLFYRTDLPLSRRRPPEDVSWEFPDVLELDLLKELDEDVEANYKGLEEWKPETDFEETLLGYTDCFSVCSPPRFTDGWPHIREEPMVDMV